jgi:hypothetical protein
MTDRTQSNESSGRAGQAARAKRPATAPAHYLGVPAEVWMGVFRNPSSRGKSGSSAAQATQD